MYKMANNWTFKRNKNIDFHGSHGIFNTQVFYLIIIKKNIKCTFSQGVFWVPVQLGFRSLMMLIFKLKMHTIYEIYD